MKKHLMIILLLFTGFNYAQVILSVPEFPTENDSIKIIFDAAQAAQNDLVGYTGDVYTHTGVNSNFGQWQHVIGNWGNNSTQPVLTRIGQDLYELVIGYPRDFYSVTNPGEHITSLNFVFRSADASKQTEDIFLEIFPEGLNVSIIEPSLPVTILQLNDQLNIKAVSSNSTTLSLFLNDSLLAQTNDDSINYTLNVTEEGKKYIIAVAEDSSSNTDADSVYYVTRGNVVIEDLPSGISTGINYTADTSVTLALFAPFKNFVYVIGDFNNWEIDPDYYMKRTSNDSIYWIKINGLTPGTEYGFQYNVDGEIIVADPYTEKILDPFNDDFISSSTYPNLKPYPKNKTTEAVSIIQTAQTPYNWEVPNFTRPAKTDLVIYELLIRDFLAAHDYKTLTDTLSYFENLGVNAIELMPITEFDGNVSWGYDPAFLFAPDKYYGPKQDLQKFVDECHKRGIAVLLDAVLNDASGKSPFVRLYNEGNYGRPTLDNPWLNQIPRHPFNVHYDFNHESLQTKALVDRFNKFWLQEYNVDGFRYDLSKGFTQKFSSTVSQWNQYDQSRIDILTRMADQVWTFDSTAYLTLEHLSDNPEEKVLADYGFMPWGKMTDPYNEATMGYHDNNKSDLTWGFYKARGWNDPNLVTYMESHDEERLMFKNLTYGNSSGSYNIKELHTALNRMKLASVFFYTIPGPKKTWQFGELGYDFSINYPSGTPDDRLTPKPIRWDYFQDTQRFYLFRVTQELIKLKKNYNVFKTDSVSLAVSGKLKRILLYSDSMDVVVIGNFDVVENSIIPNFSHTGTWYDFFPGDSIDVTDTQGNILLQPGEYHLYSSVRLPSPDDGVILEVNDERTGPAESYALNQNYPNPFNPATTIKFSLKNEEFVTLKIYDILGNEVAVLVNRQMSPGTYKLNFDGSWLSSGVYFYKISAGSFNEIKKMILLK